MTLWTELARAATAAGDEIVLRHRGHIHEIRFNGIELMSNLTSQSEEVLAIRSLRKRGLAAPQVLIAGLGMGFTLRATLDHLGPEARVEACELIPEIARWNHAPLGALADHPLRDPRVSLQVMDVRDLLVQRPGQYDIILMDTDNGPDLTVREDNVALYGSAGLAALRAALRPDGLVAFWSADISASFEARLSAEGWRWSREDVQLREGRADAFHHVYFARDGRKS